MNLKIKIRNLLHDMQERDFHENPNYNDSRWENFFWRCDEEIMEECREIRNEIFMKRMDFVKNLVYRMIFDLQKNVS